MTSHTKSIQWESSSDNDSLHSPHETNKYQKRCIKWESSSEDEKPKPIKHQSGGIKRLKILQNRIKKQQFKEISWDNSSDSMGIDEKKEKELNRQTELLPWLPRLSELPRDMISESKIIIPVDSRVVLINNKHALTCGISLDVIKSIPKTGISHLYSGNQFGTFVPSLGDGRCATFISPNGHEINIKGSGKTTYSRGFDGVLGAAAAAREFILSNYIIKYGGPSTASIAVIVSKTSLIARYRIGMEPQAVITRYCSNWVRLGTVLSLLYQSRRTDAIQVLSRNSNEEVFVSSLLRISMNFANTVAWWNAYGFYHGTVNTDNLLLNGDTLDHSSSEFLKKFDLSFCSNAIDVEKMYSFGKQFEVVRGHLERLCLAFKLTKPITSKILCEYDSTYKYKYVYHTVERWGFVPSKISCSALDHLISEWEILLQSLSEMTWSDVVYKISKQDFSNLNSISSWSDWIKRFQSASINLIRLESPPQLLNPPDNDTINNLADSQQWDRLSSLI